MHAVIVVSDVVIFAETCFWLIHYIGSREEITLRMPLVHRPSARKLVYVHLVLHTLAYVSSLLMSMYNDAMSITMSLSSTTWFRRVLATLYSHLRCCRPPSTSLRARRHARRAIRRFLAYPVKRRMTLERREAVAATADLRRSEEIVGDVKDIRGKQRVDVDLRGGTGRGRGGPPCQRASISEVRA